MSKKTYRISKKKYDKAVELLMQGDLSYTEIAHEVGIARNTLQKIREDEKTADLIRDNTDSDIKISVNKAGKTLIDLLNARSEFVRLEAAKHILELGGIQVTDKVDLNSTEGIKIIDDIG